MHEKLLAAALLFAGTAGLTVALWVRASPAPRRDALVLTLWMVLQAVLAETGFYDEWDTRPPRAALLIIPPLATIAALLLTPGGRLYLDRLHLRRLHWLHTVRVPVEITIYLLVAVQLMPEALSFSGTNPDIFSGVSAPVIVWLGFRDGRLRRPLLLGWNVVCLGLVLNVAITGVLAAPGPLQSARFADTPNLAVLLLPFVWLPSVVVPLVILAHIASLRSLPRKRPGVTRWAHGRAD